MNGKKKIETKQKDLPEYSVRRRRYKYLLYKRFWFNMRVMLMLRK